ncbi:MAG: hypothetical protein IKO44_04210 [Ruminococcus sp.]|nr:hypothetical protein [Ruminococcus sp.]
MAFEIKKSGSFRFWGDWFGRPLDNTHKPVKASLENGLLTAEFADGESLTVYGAKDVYSDEGRFYVTDAEAVVWEWDLYEEEQKSESTHCFIEYKRLADGRILKTTDLGRGIPEYLDAAGFKAVEMY